MNRTDIELCSMYGHNVVELDLEPEYGRHTLHARRPLSSKARARSRIKRKQQRVSRKRNRK